MRRLSKSQQREICRALLAGCTASEAAARGGASIPTGCHYRDKLVVAGILPPKCACGGSIAHRGSCEAPRRVAQPQLLERHLDKAVRVVRAMPAAVARDICTNGQQYDASVYGEELRALAVKVIDRNLDDLRFIAECGDDLLRHHRKRLNQIADTGMPPQEWPDSEWFVFWCRVAGLDPDYMRTRVQPLVEAAREVAA